MRPILAGPVNLPGTGGGRPERAVAGAPVRASMRMPPIQQQREPDPAWPATSLPAAARARLLLTPTQLCVIGGAFIALTANGPFLSAMLDGHSAAAPSTWLFALALVAILSATHTLLLSLLVVWPIARAALGVVLLATALASYYMQRYAVLLDPTMMRNVLKTHPAEATELIGWGLLPHLALLVGLPLAVLARVEIVRQPLLRAAAGRAAVVVASAAVAVVASLLAFQDLSAQIRNRRELRYLVTPANLVYSVGRVLADGRAEAAQPRTPVGVGARLDATWSARQRPVLFVLVVGETARAANWGMNGYARQTTPGLAQLDVINFPDVTACGTNTETSLPCMFAPVGRRNYDERRIRTSESLLHLLKRAGFDLLWRDNQSGCKGVCDGLPEQHTDPSRAPFCDGSQCLDEALLDGLDAVAGDRHGNRVVVLHMLGNHGPAYYKRYPPAMRRYVPTCDTGELRNCSREQIVNAYDNALLYTDHVLSRAIALLREQQGRRDTALLYVSDHGESLGENGLFLHGLPFAIAPPEQTRVPMVLWMSPDFSRSAGVDVDCLRREAPRPWTHDNLFHTTLGLLRVQAPEYAPELDITRPCRA